jgi:hypothetical protein
MCRKNNEFSQIYLGHLLFCGKFVMSGMIMDSVKLMQGRVINQYFYMPRNLGIKMGIQIQ